MQEHEGRPTLAIAAVIRRRDGRTLIIKRAPGIPAPGMWSPPTGRPEPGERLVAAVAREVLEETGLRVHAGAEVHRSPTADGRWLLVWFEAVLDDPDAAFRPLALAPDEVAEARWLTTAEILALAPMFPATRAFFEGRA